MNNGGRPGVPPPAALPGGGFAELDAYVALMKRCWAQNPYDRPSFAELVPELRCVMWVLLCVWRVGCCCGGGGEAVR